MKTTIIIQNETAHIVLTPETELDKKTVQFIPKTGCEATVEALSFSENQNGVMKEISRQNSIVIKLK